MIVEMDFREDYFFLGPQLITHWEETLPSYIIWI